MDVEKEEKEEIREETVIKGAVKKSKFVHKYLDESSICHL